MICIPLLEAVKSVSTSNCEVRRLAMPLEMAKGVMIHNRKLTDCQETVLLGRWLIRLIHH